MQRITYNENQKENRGGNEMIIDVSMKIECEMKDAFEIIKALENHIDWLLDLNSWPEIISVSDVKAKEVEEEN